jgi:hypothetical protein
VASHHHLGSTNERSDTMRELELHEYDVVTGGTLAGTIAMGIAGTWVSTVAGAAAGSIIPGVGTVAGAAVGFTLGTLVTIGFALATTDETAADQ